MRFFFVFERLFTFFHNRKQTERSTAKHCGNTKENNNIQAITTFARYDTAHASSYDKKYSSSDS